jgi:cytochrome c peroxidase
MNLFSKIVVIFVICFLMVLGACRKREPGFKPEDARYALVYPSYFPAPHYQPADNILTTDGIALGRMLFYDPVLSSDSSVSCGTCHSQAHAFSGHNTAFNLGVGKRKGSRNSPALFNLSWNISFMADGGINHIEIMPFAPLTNPDEMNESLPNVLHKLGRSKKYPELFRKAFGSDQVTDQKLFYALAQFMGSIISSDSRYDKFRRGEGNMDADEQAGLALFRQHCASCHREPLFTDYSFKNNGIDTVFKDQGRERITGKPADRGKFKVPSLRNVALTYPYMHDGRFYTLDAVLEHYAQPVRNSPGTDINGNMSLTATDKKQIIKFLKTLTDYTFLSNPNYSEPRQ